MDTEILARLWSILWGIVAINVGYHGFFRTQAFLDSSYDWREKWDKRTGTKFFTAGAPKESSHFQYYFSKVMGGLFIVLGVLAIFGFIGTGR